MHIVYKLNNDTTGFDLTPSYAKLTDVLSAPVLPIKYDNDLIKFIESLF